MIAYCCRKTSLLKFAPAICNHFYQLGYSVQPGCMRRFKFDKDVLRRHIISEVTESTIKLGGICFARFLLMWFFTSRVFEQFCGMSCNRWTLRSPVWPYRRYLKTQTCKTSLYLRILIYAAFAVSTVRSSQLRGVSLKRTKIIKGERGGQYSQFFVRRLWWMTPFSEWFLFSSNRWFFSFHQFLIDIKY